MALILSRRPGEAIVIETPSGEVIDVKVIGTVGYAVKFAIDAPKSTSIDRQEIYDRKKAEARRA